LKWTYDDGGRADAGLPKMTNPRDCVCRAVAIAACEPYGEVYADLANFALSERPRVGGKRSHPEQGIKRATTRRFLTQKGWVWTPTMGIGTGTKVHLRLYELPAGRLIVQVSRHLVAVVDGVVHDLRDPSRRGRRCVYGYWQKPTNQPKEAHDAGQPDRQSQLLLL
jgi:hypothetical protein